MAVNVWKRSHLVAALAVGAAVLALPGAAMAQDRGEHRGWGGGGDRGDRGDRGQGRQQGAGQVERGGGNWRGQERTWNAPAQQQAVPQAVPQAVAPAPQPSRNPSYVGQQRDGSYGAGRATARQQGWDGQRWNGQNFDRRGYDAGREQRQAPSGYVAGQRPSQWNGDRAVNRERGWNGGDRRAGWSNRSGWANRAGGNWNRDWRQDRRYDWRDWRNEHREIYRIGRYNPPYRGYAYRRLGIGIFLDQGFFGDDYWINDPGMYRLPPAYGPYRWVRYYDDALMVNIYDGEVVDVIYDFFW